jgi:hypothetical protein
MSDRTSAPPPPSAVAASGAVTIPLRSDPPYLAVGVLAVTLVCIGIFLLYFRFMPEPRATLWLAVMPGLALGTFASAAFAWWSRRRSGTMQLEAAPDRVVLREPARRAEIVDRAMPFGAALVTDRTGSGPRILVLSQRGEPTMVLDTRGGGTAPEGPWVQRTIAVDLASVAVSPATAHVLTVRTHDSLGPLLDTLAGDLESSSPLLTYALPSGEVMIVTRDEIRAGKRVLPVGAGTTARRIGIQTPAGEVSAISLASGDHALLLACLDPSDVVDGRGSSDAPDGYIPAVVFAVIAALFGLDGTDRSTTARPYRG